MIFKKTTLMLMCMALTSAMANCPTGTYNAMSSLCENSMESSFTYQAPKALSKEKFNKESILSPESKHDFAPYSTKIVKRTSSVETFLKIVRSQYKSFVKTSKNMVKKIRRTLFSKK